MQQQQSFESWMMLEQMNKTVANVDELIALRRVMNQRGRRVEEQKKQSLLSQMGLEHGSDEWLLQLPLEGRTQEELKAITNSLDRRILRGQKHVEELQQKRNAAQRAASAFVIKQRQILALEQKQKEDA
jgi:hypothetical protein